MASMEKISADLKLFDSKKENLHKAFEHSLLLLTLQWKDLEEYFDSTRKSIEQRFDELNSKEKQFDSVQLSFKERSEELNSIQKSIEERLKELRLKEEKIDLSLLSTEERSKELDSIQESINESFKELGNKEKELDSVQKLIDQRVEEFKSKEKQFDKGSKELELKEKQFDSIQKSIENRFKELEGKDKRYQERAKQLELKEKRYEELSKSLELKEKQRVLSSKVKVEEPEYMPVNNAIISSSSSANIRFCITMDGKTLQLFLNERLNQHDSMRDEVYAALRMSSDPAKLVLDAMQGFYPPFSKKGDKEFEGSVVRRSCTLLLAQLMRVSPHITPHVREEATKLAVDWKEKMKVESENPLEALGFLQLVATYGLISAFARDETFKIFETIAQHREAPGLCRALGFADKVPDFIQRLINGRQNLAAIRFIFAFELVGKFHPVPILEAYYKNWKKIADKTCEGENKLTKEQIAIAKKTITALKAVVRCIKDHKLEAEHSAESLEKIISVLNKKTNSGCIVPAAPKLQLQLQSEKKCDAPSDSIPKTQTQQKSGIKRLREAVPEDTPNAPVYAASTDHLVHSPHQQPADFSANEDMIQSLIERRRNLEAIKFIFEFELVGKFPPVPILEDYYKYWKKTADEICERENNLTREQITIAKKSIAALKATIRCIEDHKLETEHSTESIEKFISVLRKKANSGYIVPAEPKPQLQLQSRIKRMRISVSKKTPNAPVHVPSTIHSIHKPHRNPADFFTDEGAPYLGSSGGRYMNSYPDSPVSFFTSNAQREPGFPGLMDTPREPDYYDGPPPFGSPWCAFREPDIYDGSVPFGDYDFPPPFHPPFYP